MPHSRRDFLTTTAGAATATLAGTLGFSAPDTRPPNLLFVLADQWRASALGIGSDKVVRTPNVDRLASQGAHWQRAYAANPVCTPNRSCILTGRFSHQHGMIANDLMLPPSEVCWPEIYRDAGYATHYIGKWHMDGTDKPGYVPKGWRRRGFDTFEGFNRGHVYHKEYGFDDDGGPLFAKWNADGRPYYEPSLQTDLAIDFMRRKQDRPFCCYLSWGPPHTPLNPPDAWDKYGPGDIQLRPNVPAMHRQQARKDLSGYYGLCESLDFEMGRLLEFLDDSGLADNTLIVFTADHGELAGSHGKYRKGEPEEESLNVPLIMRLPGRIKSGLQTQTLCNSIDLMPTLLTLCGLKSPDTCTGHDVSNAVTVDGTPPDVESIYTEGKVNAGDDGEDEPPRRNRRRAAPPSAWRTLVTPRHKLTVRGDFEHVEQLIDLHNDPFEQDNLAGNPEHRSLQDDLLAELRRWAKQTGDVFPKIPTAARVMYTDAEADTAR
ncbi:MAG: sulfatase-like hydrolase/transferase [Planctomycetaceae bacterium]|nr:sulfatase-like hydrolase/transferase [Planctomycetaceae bacterium]